MTDEELAGSVADELSWDPKVDSDGIAVSAVDGVVTLRGTVGSFRQKKEATRAAQRVGGVAAVRNEIDVQILTHERREDADLRADVLRALMLDSVLPDSVDAHADDGRVRLTGWVDWQYQREEAEHVAGNVPGVSEVANELEFRNTTHLAADVEQNIRKAFVRNAKLDADRLQVLANDGTVTLSGQVRSWDEHDAAVAAAWAARGVQSVDDRLTVAR